MSELKAWLDSIPLADTWTGEEAAAWWSRHGPPKRSLEALARLPMDIVLPEGLGGVRAREAR